MLNSLSHIWVFHGFSRRKVIPFCQLLVITFSQTAVTNRALNRFKKRKPETNEIWQEQNQKRNQIYSSEQNQKIEMAINRLITLFYRSI